VLAREACNPKCVACKHGRLSAACSCARICGLRMAASIFHWACASSRGPRQSQFPGLFRSGPPLRSPTVQGTPFCVHTATAHVTPSRAAPSRARRRGPTSPSHGMGRRRRCPPIDLAQSRKRLQAGSAGYSMSISSIVLLLDLTQSAHDLRMYRYFFRILWPTD